MQRLEPKSGGRGRRAVREGGRALTLDLVAGTPRHQLNGQAGGKYFAPKAPARPRHPLERYRSGHAFDDSFEARWTLLLPSKKTIERGESGPLVVGAVTLYPWRNHDGQLPPSRLVLPDSGNGDPDDSRAGHVRSSRSAWERRRPSSPTSPWSSSLARTAPWPAEPEVAEAMPAQLPRRPRPPKRPRTQSVPRVVGPLSSPGAGVGDLTLPAALSDGGRPSAPRTRA